MGFLEQKLRKNGNFTYLGQVWLSGSYSVPSCFFFIHR